MVIVVLPIKMFDVVILIVFCMYFSCQLLIKFKNFINEFYHCSLSLYYINPPPAASDLRDSTTCAGFIDSHFGYLFPHFRRCGNLPMRWPRCRRPGWKCSAPPSVSSPPRSAWRPSNPRGFHTTKTSKYRSLFGVIFKLRKKLGFQNLRDAWAWFFFI